MTELYEILLSWTHTATQWLRSAIHIHLHAAHVLRRGCFGDEHLMGNDADLRD